MSDQPGRQFSIGLHATTQISASVNKQIGRPLAASTQVLPGVRVKGLRARLSRRKAWFIDILIRSVKQWSRCGAVAQHYRKVDRDGDRYTETVTMRDTDEIVHHCDEPLSKHKGHGSDRSKVGSPAP